MSFIFQRNQFFFTLLVLSVLTLSHHISQLYLGPFSTSLEPNQDSRFQAYLHMLLGVNTHVNRSFKRDSHLRSGIRWPERIRPRDARPPPTHFFRRPCCLCCGTTCCRSDLQLCRTRLSRLTLFVCAPRLLLLHLLLELHSDSIPVAVIALQDNAISRST